MTEDSAYYPYVRFYLAGDKAKEAARRNGWKVKEIFNADGQKYALVGGDYSYGVLADFNSKSGATLLSQSLLGCKSKEIAEHMSRYFAKEIFRGNLCSACRNLRMGIKKNITYEVKYVVEEELARQKVPQRGQGKEAEMPKEDSTPRQSNGV